MKSEQITSADPTLKGMTAKKYKVTEDCFVGKVGDIIILKDLAETTRWINLTQNKQGEPFAEWDLIEELSK
tara:strand:+ start:2746 stop:2958 length:213 start_codon:yes stop_codon:yes gene_type:complete